MSNEASLAYAARGWQVFPCHSITEGHCTCADWQTCGRSAGKHPMTIHGLLNATLTEVRIRKWFTLYPDANVAIATGAESGLVAVDVDPDKGGDVTLAALEAEHGPLPETPEVLTGGRGRHLFFSHPGVPIASGTDKLEPGLDIKADGGYVIAAPSLHLSGRRYEWEVLHDYETVPLAPLPAWLLEQLAAPPRQSSNGAAPHYSEEEQVRILTELREALRIIPASLDHDTWVSVGMGIHSVDSGALGLGLFDSWSQTCPAKYTSKACASAWRSFKSRPDGITKNTVFDLAITYGWRQTYSSGRDSATSFNPEDFAGGMATDGREEEPTPDDFRCTDLGNGERLIARYGRDLLYHNLAKKFLTWTGQRWEVDTHQRVKQWARHTVRAMYDEVTRLTEQAKNAETEDKKHAPAARATALLRHAVRSEAEARVNAMLNLAQMDCPVSPEQLDADLWALNCLNGTLDLRTGTLRPHRREDRITKLIPIAYDPQAQCPTSKTFSDVMAVNRETGEHRDLVDFLQKAVGYSLPGDTSEQCLFLLYGWVGMARPRSSKPYGPCWVAIRSKPSFRPSSTKRTTR